MDKDQAKQLFQRADELYQAGEYTAALELLDQLDATFPDHHRVMYPRAMCLAEIGRTTEALELCDRLIEKHGYDRAAELKQRIQKQAVQAAAGAPGIEDDLAVEDLPLAEVDEDPSAFTQAPPAFRRSGPGLFPVLGAVSIVVLAAAGAGYYLLAQQTSKENSGTDTAGATGGDPAAAPEPAASPSGAVPEIDHSGPPELINVEGGASEDGVTVNVSVEYGVWTGCGDYDCFVEKFEACEPAAIRMQTMGSFIVEYRVLGEENGVCRLEMTVVDMPPYPDWKGKSMTCPCDNTKDFIQVTEEIGPGGILEGTLQCEGPLFDAMQATLSQYQQ